MQLKGCLSLLSVTGQSEFIKWFGNITVTEVVELFLAAAFLGVILKGVSKYLISRYEANREKDAQLKEALSSVKKYPILEKQIEELKEQFLKSQKETSDRIIDMESKMMKRERNKIRDMLLNSYRYYTNPESNPSMSWTKMEAEAFWALFEDYEEAHGDGYMHTVVQPAMQNLTVVDVPLHTF